ncbi:GLPGLI family protein [Flavobacterium arsenatis]|uniref:GLPGLI family protein n=1 Tax=Flavobacterium arsenatis TaxID=1484332 RepID=A0ABU1TK43_9FLAO|nr:GLPGLI family protein [Flavobacterium arsenatis]MDR6966355.1 GLPGLI family protein [Flavobacterium arsenatis]
MKKIFFAFIVTLGIFEVHAQKEFQGMAVYESKTSTADMKNQMGKNKEITPEMQKLIEERMKGMFEKIFVLHFDRSSSVYKEEEKLDAMGGQGQGGMRMMSSMMGGGGTFYKNVKDKMYSVDKEFMGKEFLIQDSLPQLQWKMESETKQIGGYTCYKATASKPVNMSDFRNFRPKDQSKEAGKEEKKETEKKTNFMDDFELPKEILITAWYAPEIPINQGPENYWGLPGLILEVSDGKTVILCSKVVMNTKEKATIKAPKTGKTVTQKEYDEIVMKKMEELREMGNGPGGFRGMRMGR